LASNVGDGARVVIVTGAGSGMGKACAEKFAAQGWAVGALDIQERRIAELGATSGGRIIGVPADVSRTESVAAAFKEVVSRLGAPTVCINAAGVYPVTTVETANEDLYRHIFDVNVLGTVLVSQAMVSVLPSGANGSIVNFASATVYIPTPVQFLYGASKAAVVHLTRTLAFVLAPRFRVNAVAPGWVSTEGTSGLSEQMTEEVKSFPIKRAGTPEELASVVWWIAVDPAAAYITGETLNVNGGATMA
jgi:3-oxoacyl-[acyl-carrier protein] reductase